MKTKKELEIERRFDNEKFETIKSFDKAMVFLKETSHKWQLISKETADYFLNKKNLTIILCLFAICGFSQNAKEIELLKAMNVYKFPAKEIVFSKEMNEVAKTYAKILNEKTTQEFEDTYFEHTKYLCYATLSEVGYTAKEILYFFETNNGYLKQLVEGSKEVGVYATKKKCIIIFSNEVEVFFEEAKIENEE